MGFSNFTAVFDRLSESSAGVAANGYSIDPYFSGDGTKVVFLSNSTNLTGGQELPWGIYERILSTGETKLVYANSLSNGYAGGVGWPEYSLSGNEVIFYAMAGPRDEGSGVYKIDLTTKQLTPLQSITSAFLQWPDLSVDKSLLVFSTNASLMSQDKNSGNFDIYARNLTTGTVTLVSSSSTGEAAAADTTSTSHEIFHDSSRVAFVSNASNLVSGDTNGKFDIFVKDLTTGQTTRVSTTATGGEIGGDSFSPVVSPDGTKLVFESASADINPDGQAVARVFMKDLVSGAITVLSTSAAGALSDGSSGPNGSAGRGAFSNDGKLFAFQSTANNLTSDDDGQGKRDLYIKNIETGQIARIAIDGFVQRMVFSPDGTTLLVSTPKDIAATGDSNGLNDIFTVDISKLYEKAVFLGSNWISEGESAAERVVGTFGVENGPAGVTYSYEIKTDASGLFQVSGQTIAVRPGAVLDFETAKSHTVTVLATGSDGSEVRNELTVKVTDVNERPATLDLSNDSISETAGAGSVIGELSATDPDTGDSLTFSLTEDASGLFEVVGNKLKLKDGATPDYETDTSHRVQVAVTDAGGEKLSKFYVVKIDPVFDETPASVSLVRNEFKEGTDGGAILSGFSVSDKDKGDSFTFELTDAADTTTFSIVDGKLCLADGASFDFEKQDRYTVELRVTDEGGNTLDDVISVAVTDINERPTGVSLKGAGKIPESAKAGTIVGKLAGTDPDSGDSKALDYKVTSKFFTVNAKNELVVKAGAKLDFEKSPVISVMVTVTDGDGLSFRKSIDVTVTNSVEILGTKGNDSLDGTKASEDIDGLAGDDELFGSGGVDVLNGSKGNDLLVGGKGMDKLTGGPGADTFRYDTMDDLGDTITDFKPGEDKLAFSVKKVLPGVKQSDIIINFDDVVGTKPQFVYVKDVNVLYFDKDGTGGEIAFPIVELLGVNKLSADDILLV